jgi:endonuclease G, mitochondrial
MKKTFEVRLREAVADIERTDGRLAEELRDVRSGRGREKMAELAPRLESMGFGPINDLVGLTRETIVLRTGRPVLAVVNDEAQLAFTDAESEIWRSRLTGVREQLGRAIRAVGRIEVNGHSFDWLGTGWLVAPDVVVTNRHVASEFASRRGEGFVFRQGFGGAMSARIDFLEEIGHGVSREFRLSKILHVEGEDGPDVAFLRVEQTGGDALAAPIALSGRAAGRGQNVAVIGYPARDSRVPDQDLMLKIFGDVFDKKRLAPGQVKAPENGLLLHDCSTLGGNSGSVVLDLESGEAVAIHFSGRFLEANYAVPARTIARVLRQVRPDGAGSQRRVPRPDDERSETETEMEAEAEAEVDVNAAAFTIPLRIRVEIGSAARDGGTARRARRAMAAPVVQVRAGDDQSGEVEADEADDVEEIEEGRPEDYSDREGYDPEFLGVRLQMPEVLDSGDVLSFRVDGQKRSELTYEHFSVVMSKSRRLCLYSAVNIDGGRSRKARRTGWRVDPRIEREQQIVTGVYGNAPRFSRGHMTRREDPIWGTADAATRGNSDSMHVTNAVPQMQPFNAGVWLQLEDYALENAREDDMRITVMTGPVFRDDDPLRFGVKVPVTFWKIIGFIHEVTGGPCVTGYTMSQKDFLREEEFVFGQHETAQVPISVIEEMAGLSFAGDFRRLDPLERVTEARTRTKPLRDLREIRFR